MILKNVVVSHGKSVTTPVGKGMRDRGEGDSRRGERTTSHNECVRARTDDEHRRKRARRAAAAKGNTQTRNARGRLHAKFTIQFELLAIPLNVLTINLYYSAPDKTVNRNHSCV